MTAVKILAVSGLRSGLAPTFERSWVAVSPLPAAAPQEGGAVARLRQGSEAGGKMSAWAPQSSLIEGARKAVEKGPRTEKSGEILHRAPSLYGFVMQEGLEW